MQRNKEKYKQLIQEKRKMSKVLRVLKAAGDVAEIVVATSIIIDVVKQAKKYCREKFCKVTVVETAPNKEATNQYHDVDYEKKQDIIIVTLEVLLSIIKGVKKLRSVLGKK